MLPHQPIHPCTSTHPQPHPMPIHYTPTHVQTHTSTHLHTHAPVHAYTHTSIHPKHPHTPALSTSRPGPTSHESLSTQTQPHSNRDSKPSYTTHPLSTIYTIMNHHPLMNTGSIIIRHEQTHSDLCNPMRCLTSAPNKPSPPTHQTIKSVMS